MPTTTKIWLAAVPLTALVAVIMGVSTYRDIQSLEPKPICDKLAAQKISRF